jgi:hypothetical protein
VTALAARAGVQWALVDGREVWCREGGRVWQSAAQLPEGLTGTCLYADRSGVIVGTLQAHLGRIGDQGWEPIQSFEAVEGRAGWYTPWGAPADARTISGDANGGMYVNVHVGGIVRSLDGGDTWEPTIDVDADVHQVLVEPRSGRILAAAAGGLHESTDAGQTWANSTRGLHARYQRAVAVAGDHVLVSSSTGPSGRQSAIYRRTLANQDEPFERCTEGLPDWFPNNIDSTCLAASESRAVFGTEQGQMFASEDAGRTWRLEREGLPSVRCVLLPASA